MFGYCAIMPSSMAIKLTRSSGSNFPQPPSPKLFRNIAVTFVLITLAVIAIALWTSSVKATVTVKAKSEPVSVDTALDISPSPSSDQIKGRIVSGTFTEAKEYAVETTSVPTSTSPAPTPSPEPQATPTKTTGRVKIINNYSKDQPLVVKTRLLTSDGKLFRITKTVNAPSGGSVEVEAVSDEAGSQYQIPVGTKFTIPGLWKDLQPLIFAQAVTEFKSGGAVSVPEPKKSTSGKILTADAQAKAYEHLYAAALEKAKQSLSVEAAAEAGWEAIYLIGTTQRQSNAAAGQEVDSFLAQVKITVTAVFFPREDVMALLRTRLKEKLPQGYTLADLDLSKATFKLENTDMKKGTARLAISAEAMSKLSAVSPDLRKDLIVGLPADEVIRKWSVLDGVEEVDVELHPSWVHRLPSMKDKITIIIN